MPSSTEGHFDFPKAHAPEHYLFFIEQFGTTDNYNTEFTERLHIDLVKDAWRASNRKDAILQMIRWLTRREKIFLFEARFLWLQGRIKRRYTKTSSDFSHISIARKPSLRNVSIDTVVKAYGATDFSKALKTFIAQYRDISDHPRYRARSSDQNIPLHFNHVDIWHRVKFTTPSVQLSTAPDIRDIADATPIRVRHGKEAASPARFDTVFVNDTGAEETGIKGWYMYCFSSQVLTLFIGLRVGRLRVIFKIPTHLNHIIFGSHITPPQHLAYVEWYTKPGKVDPNSGMYPVSRSKLVNGSRDASVIELSSLSRPCQLCPNFGKKAPRLWTSSEVLDQCNQFFINNFVSHLTYQTIY